MCEDRWISPIGCLCDYGKRHPLSDRGIHGPSGEGAGLFRNCYLCSIDQGRGRQHQVSELTPSILSSDAPCLAPFNHSITQSQITPICYSLRVSAPPRLEYS